jgi:hypothetical protein
MAIFTYRPIPSTLINLKNQLRNHILNIWNLMCVRLLFSFIVFKDNKVILLLCVNYFQKSFNLILLQFNSLMFYLVKGNRVRVMVFNSTFQLYHGNQFYWWRKSEYPAKTTDLIAKLVVNPTSILSLPPRLLKRKIGKSEWLHRFLCKCVSDVCLNLQWRLHVLKWNISRKSDTADYITVPIYH